MDYSSNEYYESSSCERALKILDLDTVRMINNETEQKSLQPKNFDDMLTSILKDLEFAEVSLQSSSRLLDPSDNELDMNTEERSETEENLDINLAYGKTEDDSVENSTSNNESNSDDRARDEQESKVAATEPELTTPSQQTFQEEIKRFTQAWNDEAKKKIDEKELKDNCPKKPDDSISNRSEIETDLNVPLPNTNPYINFIQDFKAKYKGQEVTPTTLIALAASKWRKMSKTEKQVYKNSTKSHFRKNKQVEKLKSYIKSYNLSEECLFQNSDL